MHCFLDSKYKVSKSSHLLTNTGNFQFMMPRVKDQ